MHLHLYFSHRFLRDAEGKVYSPQNYNYDLLKRRYLQVFDSMSIFARIMPQDNQTVSPIGTEGPGVEVVSVGDWVGPMQFLSQRARAKKIISDHYDPGIACIMIVPGIVGTLALPTLKKHNHPYAVEVVGDPWDVFSPGASNHPLRPLFRRMFANRLKKQCHNACASSYVTSKALQKRYPPAPGAFTTNYSSIELKPEAFAAEPKAAKTTPGRRRVLCVGTLAVLYKAPDVLIDAIAKCVEQGTDVELAWVGDGQHREEMQQRANDLGLQDRVLFLGQLAAGKPVRDALATADLFVLPSRQEGLPRAMIEAMAAGLPCIGSNVGGIPELLDDPYMVNPNDADALAQKITEMLSDPEHLNTCAKRNLERPLEYRHDILNERRKTLYRTVAEATTNKK